MFDFLGFLFLTFFRHSATIWHWVSQQSMVMLIRQSLAGKPLWYSFKSTISKFAGDGILLLHDPEKVDQQRSWRSTFGVCSIIVLEQFVKLCVLGQLAKNAHNSLNRLEYFDKLKLTRPIPRGCKRTFIVGRGCAELQILKKWKWPLSDHAL